MIADKIELTADEISRRGDEFIATRVTPTLRSEDTGKFIVVDVFSWDYELDTSDIAAVTRPRVTMCAVPNFCGTSRGYKPSFPRSVQKCGSGCDCSPATESSSTPPRGAIEITPLS